MLIGLVDYFGDACYQALAYWIMSALSNDPFTLARFAGLYKAVQSAGSAGSFGMDAVNTPWLNELVSSLWLVRVPDADSRPSARELDHDAGLVPACLPRHPYGEADEL